MGRTLTVEQKISRHRKKQERKNPLWTEAGLFDDLVQAGVVSLRDEAFYAAQDAAATKASENRRETGISASAYYRERVRELLPHLFDELDAFASTKHWLTPEHSCTPDWWHQHIRKHLGEAQYWATCLEWYQFSGNTQAYEATRELLRQRIIGPNKKRYVSNMRPLLGAG